MANAVMKIEVNWHGDTSRLDFMIANPDLAVVEYKGKWLVLHFRPLEGEGFESPREAIDAAMRMKK